MCSIPAYRNIVQKMFHVPQTLENIITAASSLDDDPVAIESGLQSIPGTWRWQNDGTTLKLSSQHKTFSLFSDDKSVHEMESKCYANL